jgi:organic hydroperoxide reductase OsmC/OhrA
VGQSFEMILPLVRRDILNYETQGVWDGASGGKIHLPGLPDLAFDTPARFGGLGRYACADQLFLSSLAACLITTFLYFKRKLRFTPIRVEVTVKARIALVGRGGYRFSRIKAILLVRSEKCDLIVARRCADLAVAYCHLTQTVGEIVPVSVKSQVVMRRLPSARGSPKTTRHRSQSRFSTGRDAKPGEEKPPRKDFASS